jgi:micrococcal nuclease
MTKSKTGYIISAIIFLALLLMIGYVLFTRRNNEPTYFKVVKVVDGDTIDVDIYGSIQRVRLIGIDTPEVVDPRKPIQCFGQEASDKAKELLTDQKVRLEPDFSQDDKDQYNRLLRYVFLPDNTNVNQLMIAQGYAHEYTYNLPYQYQAEFKQAEASAKENKLGLWADDACNGNTAHKDWLTFTDKTINLSFQYPKVLTTKYIHIQNWPPQIKTETGSFVCNESGTEITAAGKTEKRIVDNRTYCLTKESEGAAGSTYTNYIYAFAKADKMITLIFSLRAVQCDNYDDPQKSKCKAERESFDVDAVADEIIQTLR